MYEHSQPIAPRWLSAAADQIITDDLRAAYKWMPYGGEPTGAGRTAQLSTGGGPIGLLWTNDRDGCDIIKTPQGDNTLFTAVALTLRMLHHENVPAGEAFDRVLAQFQA